MDFQVLHLFPTDPFIWIFVVIQFTGDGPVTSFRNLVANASLRSASRLTKALLEIGDNSFVRLVTGKSIVVRAGCDSAQGLGARFREEIGVPKMAALSGLKPTSSKKGKTY